MMDYKPSWDCYELVGGERVNPRTVASTNGANMTPLEAAKRYAALNDKTGEFVVGVAGLDSVYHFRTETVRKYHAISRAK